MIDMSFEVETCPINYGSGAQYRGRWKDDTLHKIIEE